MADKETMAAGAADDLSNGKAKRAKPTEGWTKEGEIFTKVVECDTPEAAMKLARKVLGKAQKQSVIVSLGFEDKGLKVGLPAEGKKFTAAARPIARSLGREGSDEAAA